MKAQPTIFQLVHHCAHCGFVQGNVDWPWCLLRRSCCRSVKATEIASCLSTTCCLGRTPVLALPNTSMWTTSVNQVSSAARLSFVPSWSPLSPILILHFPTATIPFTSSSFLGFFPPLTQLNTKDMWCVREGRWSCAVSPPGCWTSMQLSMGEVWAKLTPALHTWQDHPHLVSQRDIQYSHMVVLKDNGLQRIYVLYVYII